MPTAWQRAPHDPTRVTARWSEGDIPKANVRRSNFARALPKGRARIVFESNVLLPIRHQQVERLAPTRNERPLTCRSVASQESFGADDGRVTRPRVLFICGSLNQTTQLHDVARALGGVAACFTPFYGAAYVTLMRRLGLLESTIGGDKLRGRCLDYLHRNELTIDLDGVGGHYDLIVTCTDVALPENAEGTPLIVVQEGILDPPGLTFELVRRFPGRLPRWLAGTSATGLSAKYQRFCVASQGYRDLFVARGADPARVVVTGIPNFDDCAAFLDNDFPHRGYALVCSSDARETFKLHDRSAFIRRALRIAGRRELIFKLHPNERAGRARREIAQLAPGALVFSEGPTNHMIANCSVLITEWSSVAFVGIALGKEVHSSHPMSELRRLMPEQNGTAAQCIARVCEESLRTKAHRQVESEVAA